MKPRINVRLVLNVMDELAHPMVIQKVQSAFQAPKPHKEKKAFILPTVMNVADSIPHAASSTPELDTPTSPALPSAVSATYDPQLMVAPKATAQLKRRFTWIKKQLPRAGALAGTAHKRLLIPHDKLTENDILHLGFEPVTVAIPEAGQDRFSSFRHPENNFHIHAHPEGWTIHEDQHSAATMLAKKAKGAKETTKAFLSGIPHVSEEGLPGLYYYAKGRLGGHKSTAQRVWSELDNHTRRRLLRLKRSPTYTPASTQKQAELRTTLQPHQKRVVDKLQAPDQEGLVVAHGLGSGKTLTAIAAQEALNVPSTVLTPAALQANYLKEIDKHTQGMPNTVTFDTLQRVSRNGSPIDTGLLVVDEAHKLREPGSKTHAALSNATASKKLLLTASPVYNRPYDIAPLVNLVAKNPAFPKTRADFDARYLQDVKKKPSMWGRLRGVKPGVVTRLDPSKKQELQQILNKYVDYHENAQTDFPTVSHENVKVPMSAKQQETYDALLGKAPYWVQYKIRKGLPPTKQESQQLNAFLTAARQVANTTRAYQPDTNSEQPKIDAAYSRLQNTLKDNAAKAVVYSNYLESGLNPYREKLDKDKIPYGMFTGEMRKNERDALVQDYNADRIKVLLLSSAGGEGLDLKGTRLIQLLDPHWNNEKLRQVEGRGIRYKSHEKLPPEQRNVLVENYLATRSPSGLLEKLKLSDPGQSMDEYLSQMAKNKDALNQEVRDLLAANASSN